MKKYIIACDVTAVSGTQCWSVVAKNEKEALAKFAKGEHEFEYEELEVQDLGEPEIIDEEDVDG